MDNPYLQAAWFEELLVEDVSHRALNVNKNIARHWEGLSNSIQSEVTDFATKVTEFLCGLNRSEAIEIYGHDNFGKDQAQVLAEANCYHWSHLQNYRPESG